MDASENWAGSNVLCTYWPIGFQHPNALLHADITCMQTDTQLQALELHTHHMHHWMLDL